jgi:hypothetical protein
LPRDPKSGAAWRLRCGTARSPPAHGQQRAAQRPRTRAPKVRAPLAQGQPLTKTRETNTRARPAKRAWIATAPTAKRTAGPVAAEVCLVPKTKPPSAIVSRTGTATSPSHGWSQPTSIRSQRALCGMRNGTPRPKPSVAYCLSHIARTRSVACRLYTVRRSSPARRLRVLPPGRTPPLVAQRLSMTFLLHEDAVSRSLSHMPPSLAVSMRSITFPSYALRDLLHLRVPSHVVCLRSIVCRPQAVRHTGPHFVTFRAYVPRPDCPHAFRHLLPARVLLVCTRFVVGCQHAFRHLLPVRVPFSFTCTPFVVFRQHMGRHLLPARDPTPFVRMQFAPRCPHAFRDLSYVCGLSLFLRICSVAFVCVRSLAGRSYTFRHLLSVWKKTDVPLVGTGHHRAPPTYGYRPLVVIGFLR